MLHLSMVWCMNRLMYINVENEIRLFFIVHIV